LGSGSIFAIILITSSRAGLLTYMVELFLYLFFFSKKRVLISSIIIGITVIFTLFYTINFKNNFIISTVQESYQALNSFLFEKSKYEDSIGLRQKYIVNGMKQLKHTYFWGVGGGNSGNIEYHQNVPDAEKLSRISMHNFWIEILVDGGLIFAVIFYIWYLMLIYESHKILKKSTDLVIKYYSSSIFVALTGFIMGAVSASSVIYELPAWILLGISVAVINVYRKSKNEVAVVS
jgi:teichuronic acid biosynthesis protein TuaE